MDKKFRILASLLTPILATPVIAAACNSKKEQDKNEKTDNNQNSESPVNPNETGDEEEKKKIEEEKKLKEKQEQEDKNNVEKVRKIIEKQKDAFGSFHTQKEFVDQINVYAKDKKINGLTLQNKEDENKPLNVDTDGGKNNKIKLQLGSQKFVAQLGIVLEDAVRTKYYIENNKEKIITDPDGKFSSLKDKNQNVVITQIGYSLKDKSSKREKVIEIHKMPKNTKEVPEHLPLKIKSLKLAFNELNSEEVLNLDKWDVSNVESMETMFFDAKKFNQDISKWKTKNVTNMTGLFSGAHNFNKPLNLWNVSKVTTMTNMFDGASKFNQDLNDWDVSKVINMEEMFRSAESFNGKIGDWNVENVETLDDMFLYATKFQQDLSEWKTKKVKSKRWDFIFNHTYEYKSKVLKAWMENNK